MDSSPLNHHFPMVFLWFSYGFPMVFLWFSYGFPMVFLWFSYGFPMKSMVKSPEGTQIRIYQSTARRGAAYHRCRRPCPLGHQLAGDPQKRRNLNGKNVTKPWENHRKITGKYNKINFKFIITDYKWRFLAGNAIRVFLMAFAASHVTDDTRGLSV